MNPTHEEALFALVLAKPAERRAAFLEKVCEGDAPLRARLEALLAAHDATGVIPAGDSVQEQLAPTMQLAEPLADEAVGQTLGRYKLLERVGEGGCGVVYVAEQTEPVRRRVALKVIKLGMDTKQVVARFEAERQALAMMDHPNIAKVLDAGTTEVGRPYFVMELVRGIRITDYCDQSNLSTKDRLDLFIRVCHAIQHAHQKGIIHRDIKPSNILVTLHDGVPVPKVIDFGIAKATEGRLTDATVYTQLNQFIGTPAYMSPEQAEMSGLDIDTRSDIYSLGVLLYELLTGSTPFDGKELMSRGIDAMRKTIREKEPPRPSTRLETFGADQLTTTAKRRSVDTAKLLHQLKGDLDWIVMKCLEKDRQRRYETANGLAADIGRHLSNEPVIARPPSTAYRLQKAFRRNKLVFAAGSAVVIALVAGLCLAALGWRQARGERDKALLARAGEEAQRKMAVEASERARAGELEARRLAALARRTAYVADMALAHQAAAQGNVARAKDLLKRYFPKNGEEDLRGFEWRYIWTQTRSDETARVGEYSGFHGGIALSPDGVYLASVTDRGVEIRSFKNRALILTLTNAGGAPIQFSPDSQRLVTTRGVTTPDCSLVLWNTRSWQQEGEFPGATYPFAFVRHGDVIVAGQDDHLSLWSVQDSRKIADLPGTKLFNANTSFRALAVSSDGHRVFLGYTNRIRVWDLRSRTELDPLVSPMVRSSTSIDVSREGLLAAAHWNGNVTLWDTETRQNLHTFRDHLGAAHCAAVSPDGAYLATAGTDQNILLYETRGRKLLRRFKGHEGAVFALQFSSDGRWLVSGSTDDGSLRLWDVASPSQEEGVEMKASLGRLALRFTDSNRSVVGWSSNGYTRINVRTGTATPIPIGPAPIADSNNVPVRLASVSPDGNRAALRSGDNRSLSIWNLPAGTEQVVLLTNTPGQIWRPEFSADGKYLAVPVAGLKTRIWNTTDWSSYSLEDSASTNLLRLVFSLNGTRLLKALAPGEDGGGEVLDLGSGKVLHSVTEKRALGQALSPDGTLLAVGTQDGLVQLWNVDRRQKIGTLRGHVQFVLGVAFSPDGRTLVSGAGNQVKLWSVETQQEILAITVRENLTSEFTFSSDGLCLATRSNADRLFFWRAPSFEEIAATEARDLAASRSVGAGTAEIKQP